MRSIAFFASNLDEFFMVRVAGLKRRIAAGMAVRAASGMMPRDVLEAIWTRAAEQSLRHAEFFRDDIVPSLSANGIDLVRWDDLDREEQKFASGSSRTASSRCSRRWRSTRPTPSPTSPASR